MNERLDAVKAPGVREFLVQCVLHLELVQIEWREEKLRLLKLLVMLLLSVGLLVCSLIAISTLILMLAWDTPLRLPSIAALAVLYSVTTGFVWYRFNTLIADGADSFADSRREISADFRLLRDRLDL